MLRAIAEARNTREDGKDRSADKNRLPEYGMTLQGKSCEAGARAFVHEAIEQVIVHLIGAKFEHTNNGNTMASKINESGCNLSTRLEPVHYLCAAMGGIKARAGAQLIAAHALRGNHASLNGS